MPRAKDNLRHEVVQALGEGGCPTRPRLAFSAETMAGRDISLAMLHQALIWVRCRQGRVYRETGTHQSFKKPCCTSLQGPAAT